MYALRTLFVAIIWFFPQWLWAQMSPIPMLENTAQQILQALEQNKAGLKKNPQIIYRVVESYLLPKVDVAGMSRSVLGRQAWSKATPSERSEFSKAFTQLVIRTYATPLAQYSDETVKFLPIRGSFNGRFLRVNSIIVRTKGNNIPLNYSLVSINGEWKIYDLTVEGVSLLQSFRSQFADALQHASMADLIKQLRDRKKAT